MNYYEHHLGDYVRHTAHLSMLEDGAYRRLLDAYYIREEPLPLALRDVHRLVRAASKQDREAVDTVLREFFTETLEGWRHSRCDREIARYQDKQRKAKASADARWSKASPQSDGNAIASADALPDAMRTHSEGNAPRARAPTRAPARPSPQSPDTKHQSPEEQPLPPAVASPLDEPTRPPSVAAAPPASSAHRLPEGWELPKAWGDWALDQFPQWTPEKVRLEGAKFADHWRSKPGKDATKLDWQATWRNWCRSDIAHRDDPKPRQPVADTATRDAEARGLLGFGRATEELSNV